MSHRAPRPRRDPFSADELVEVLGTVSQMPVAVAFDISGSDLELHLRPIAPDHRAGSAGLFGVRALDGWCAVGVVAEGTAGDAESGRVLSEDVVLRVVVTRSGEVAARTTIDGVVVDLAGHGVTSPRSTPVPRPDDPTGRSQGLLVDCLHRVLGLECPGEPPDLTTLAWHVWLADVLRAAAHDGGIGRAEAAALHPGRPGVSSVGPLVETLTTATLQAAAATDWHGMHRRAASGRFGAGELSAADLRWMDTTLFARWAFSALPDAESALDALRALGCAAVVQMLLEVRTAVEREVARSGSAHDDDRLQA